MKIGKGTKRGAALLLALVIAAGLIPAALADASKASDPMDVDLIMAQNAVTCFNLRGEDGKLLQPRRAPEMFGRGVPDEAGVEPDYRGVVGYASLQADWEVSEFNTFSQTPWLLPVYEKKDGGWEEGTGSIKHKTPVLVADQEIREDEAHQFRGYLKVVRLDTQHITWIDAARFVTVPYWTYPLQEAIKYGYCVAVYRNTTRYEPMDRKKHRGTLPDGIRVLMCYTVTAPYASPDRENNPLPGIIFRNGEKKDTHRRIFLFFNEEDMTLIY